MVICFSTILAPNATAATGINIPLSCPEYPTVVDNCFRFSKNCNPISSYGAGYVELANNNENCNDLGY